ncbi:hypothetical protein C0Z18_30055 [Trinickia dabaoshanensis]|uniref:Uncharacterized protein n=1 Tax=Trinickia dabaoshanensis TaxID=564714 RepID=A0A2N7VC72_9BURK|nr:hypothetical protein C0Z18_30055 [Trinickia dabaoshanensis]
MHSNCARLGTRSCFVFVLGLGGAACTFVIIRTAKRLSVDAYQPLGPAEGDDRHCRSNADARHERGGPQWPTAPMKSARFAG